MMTSTDAGQMFGECSLWRDQLRSFRDKLSNNQALLRKSASHQSSRDELLQLEHLHNQLHIQLINIHDLKHTVKKHLLRITYEIENMGKLSDNSLARHDLLKEEFHNLDSTLLMVCSELESFISDSVF